MNDPIIYYMYRYYMVLCITHFPRIPIPTPAPAHPLGDTSGRGGPGGPFLTIIESNRECSKVRTYILIELSQVSKNVHFSKNRKVVLFVYDFQR